MRMKLKYWIIAALFAAVIGVLAQVTIPLPLVPITGQTLAVGLCATILGSRLSTLAVLLYCLLGLAGAPVFANFHAGPSVLFGPTGGYIIGFIPTAFVTGIILEKTSFRFPQAVAANIAGMFIPLATGTAWLKWAADLDWKEAWLSGFVPFLLPGIVKAVIAAWLGIEVRKRLIQARVLEESGVQG